MEGTMAKMSGITVKLIFYSVSFALERARLLRNDPEVSINKFIQSLNFSSREQTL